MDSAWHVLSSMLQMLTTQNNVYKVNVNSVKNYKQMAHVNFATEKEQTKYASDSLFYIILIQNSSFFNKNNSNL